MSESSPDTALPDATLPNATSANAAPLAEPRPAATGCATWLGLCISLFSLIAVSQFFHFIAPHPGVALTLAREASMFACAGLVLWIVRRRERLPLTSIGIGTSPLWKSLAWGVVMAVACIIPAALIAKYGGYAHSAASHNFDKLPVWPLIFLVVARARESSKSFSIASIQSTGCSASVSAASPRPSSRSPSSPRLIPREASSTSSWRSSSAPVFTAFYLWRRDLVSNIFGHFLIDFIANVIPPMLA